MRHAEIEGMSGHERKDAALSPVFVPRITNIQRLTATIEQVVHSLDYTLKIIYTNAIKIMTTKFDCNKIILDTRRKRKSTSTHINLGKNVLTVFIRNLRHSV